MNKIDFRNKLVIVYTRHGAKVKGKKEEGINIEEKEKISLNNCIDLFFTGRHRICPSVQDLKTEKNKASTILGNL